MGYTTYINLAKPDYKLLRYDVPVNENFDIIDDGFRCFANGNEPGDASSDWPEITLTEGILWRDTTNHALKVRGAAAWETIYVSTRRSRFNNISDPGAPPADSSFIYGTDQTTGNSCPHVKTENGSILKLYQQAHIADINATAITSLTNAFGTADGTLEDIGDTSSSDQSGVIENNFKECTTEIASLKTVIDDLRSKFNSLLVYFENNGFIATS